MKNEGRTAPPAEIAQVFAFVAGSNLIPPAQSHGFPRAFRKRYGDIPPEAVRTDADYYLSKTTAYTSSIMSVVHHFSHACQAYPVIRYKYLLFMRGGCIM